MPKKHHIDSNLLDFEDNHNTIVTIFSKIRLRYFFLFILILNSLVAVYVIVSTRSVKFDTQHQSASNISLPVDNAISKYNVFDRKSRTICSSSSNLTSYIILPKLIMDKYNLNDISINNDNVTSNGFMTKYNIVSNIDTIKISPVYLSKPSLNTLTLSNGHDKISYNYKIEYSYTNGKEFDKTLWSLVPANWIVANNDGVNLFPPDNHKVNSLAFQRKFKSNVTVEATIGITKLPVNFSIYIGGTSVLFGMNDDKTVQIIQTRQHDNDIANPIVSQQSYKSKFHKYKTYLLSVTKDAAYYDISIHEAGTDNIYHFNYVDKHPSLTDRTKSSTTLESGFRIWRNGNKLLLKNIKISSNEPA